MNLDRTPFPKSAFEVLAPPEARHWWFRARNRVIMWVLRSRIGDIRNFLEIGCGIGFVLDGTHQDYPDDESDPGIRHEDRA